MNLEDILEDYDVEFSGTIKFVKKQDKIALQIESLRIEDKEDAFKKLEMLTQEEVATLLKTSRQNISMLREVGILKAIKVGQRYLFSIEELQEFQLKYKGYDVGNRVKATEAYRIVEGKWFSYIIL